MVAVAVWLAALTACAMVFPRRTRNAGYFALAGSTLGLLFHYDIATIPQVRNVAIMLWSAGALLFVGKTVPGRRRRTA